MEQVVIPINNEKDIVIARQTARELARKVGFGSTDQAKIATAVSELARNIVVYAQKGEVKVKVLEDSPKRGIEILAIDQGPGIINIQLALTDGYSSSKGLGIGLPGAQRLMSEFFIDSSLGKGTRVLTRKWVS